MRSEDAAATPGQRPWAALEQWLTDLYAQVARLPGSRFIPPVLIFVVALAGYRVSQTSAEFYQHQVYLAEALLHGSFDVNSAGLPEYYQDVVAIGDAKYLAHGPAPAFLLMPGVAIWGTSFSQIDFALFLGAVNAVLFWYLLGMVRVGEFSRWLGVIFFTFGTVHFYSATEGTLWFYNHISAVFFLQIAIILFLKRTPVFLSAAFLGLAWLSRGPIIAAMPFFIYGIIVRHDDGFSLKSLIDFGFYKSFLRSEAFRNVIIFGIGFVPIVLFYFYYNWARFDDPFDTGFQTVSEAYTGSGIQYSFYRVDYPDAAHFPLFDIRNIPLHIYTMFMMPPVYHPDLSVFRPSPYGLSILFTSPAFIYAFFVKRKTPLKPACWMAVGLITIPLFMYQSQGWVQYGYRFVLDYLPFLGILTVMGFDDNRSPNSRALQIALIAVSIASGSWGRYWANRFGW